MDKRLKKIYYFYFCSNRNDTMNEIKEQEALQMIKDGRIDELERYVDLKINEEILEKIDYINFKLSKTV